MPEGRVRLESGVAEEGTRTLAAVLVRRRGTHRMSTLVLVRHGQAEAFSDTPDQLSPLGWEQARTLGRYWIEQGVRFNATFHGSLRRQRETFEAVAEEYQRAGVALPAATELPGLNEYGTQDLTAVIAPRLAADDEEFAPLWDAWKSESNAGDRNRRFQLMYEVLASRWMEGKIDEPGLEPWEAFHLRVRDAIKQLMASSGRGVRLAAFTSGGPIGVAVQSCLRAPAATALEVNWRVRNTSLTSFLFSGSRLSLDGFNELPHLAETSGLASFR